MLQRSACAVLALGVAAAAEGAPNDGQKRMPSAGFGGWLFLDHDGPGGGTAPAFVSAGTDLLFFSFIDPATMAPPASFRDALPRYAANHTVMFTIGGEDWGAKWATWTHSETAAVQMARQVGQWRKQFPGLAGIDIDAEGQVEQASPEVFAAFVRTLKLEDPEILISLCVYGNPEGRKLHNYLVNNLLTNATVDGVDWINIMAYAGSTQNVKCTCGNARLARLPLMPLTRPQNVCVGVCGGGSDTRPPADDCVVLVAAQTSRSTRTRPAPNGTTRSRPQYPLSG
jgi:hypothetical protein